MKRCVVLSVLLLTMGLSALTGCGGGTPSRSFLFSGNDTLMFMEWTEDAGHLAGNYLVDGKEFTLAGSYQGQTYVLQVGTQSFTAMLSGTVLKVTALFNEVELWYAGSRQDYDQLFNALTAYRKVHADRENLLAFQRLPQLPNDSRAQYYHTALLTAHARVSSEAQALKDIRHAGSRTCTFIVDFYAHFPAYYQDRVLQLPFSDQQVFVTQDQMVQTVVAKSGLAQTVSAYQRDVQAATVLPFPHVNGLPTPWKIVPGQELTWGVQHIEALQQEVRADIPQFTDLQSQARVVQQQVDVLAGKAHCS